MRVKINSTGEIKEVKQVGDKLFDKENNWYSLSQVILLDDWRPASELPPKSKRIIVCYKDKHYDLYTSQSSFLVKKNEYIGVPEYAQKTLMWCYPPKEK
jgi:hypothetical protein